MLNWITLIPAIISAAGTVKDIISIARGNSDIVTKIKEEVPHIATFLEDYASKFFPSVQPQFHIAAAAMVLFDQTTNRWIQETLNFVSPMLGLPDPALTVDGFYGPKTQAAAKAVQEKIPGLVTDGWIGNLSRIALEAFMVKKQAIV
jgi:peptidoglycan hydrolase-like protein with peptidoglycan-binding domain